MAHSGSCAGPIVQVALSFFCSILQIFNPNSTRTLKVDFDSRLESQIHQ